MNIEELKKKMIDGKGGYMTQGLFLEIDYNYDNAIYTLKDKHYTTKGKKYYSLKQLYLEIEDVVEYEFANTYLLGWGHWQRICNNKRLLSFIETWREELELKIRSHAIKDIIDASADEKGFQAMKWLADKGWGKNKVGRPTKDESEQRKRMKSRLDEEFGDDVARMSDWK